MRLPPGPEMVKWLWEITHVQNVMTSNPWCGYWMVNIFNILTGGECYTFTTQAPKHAVMKKALQEEDDEEFGNKSFLFNIVLGSISLFHHWHTSPG